MKFLIYSLAVVASACLVFGFEIESGQYEIADALVKHADMLKQQTENHIIKYLNHSEDYTTLMRLAHDIHRVEAVSEYVHNMSQMENMTEHQLRNFHLLELELLALENRVEEEIYHLEHNHHHHPHADFDIESESGRYEIVDALVKHADMLKQQSDNDVQKYLNNSEDHSSIVHLEHDMHRVEALSKLVHNMSQMENMTEHQLRHFHLLQVELLALENRVEEEMYHLEHHHRHHHHPHADLDIENESERYEIADALVKHADSLQELANKDIEKYKNNSDDHSSIVRLEHDMHRVEFLSKLVHNMSQMENMTEHQLRRFHLLEMELLALENRVEEDMYHLEHHHHHHHHHHSHEDQIIADVESGRYEIADALVKHSDTLKERTENDVRKYLNNSEDYSILIHLEHDIHRVESVSQMVHNMSQMENMTEHQLRNFHLLELELLALENRVEEEIYHLEHHHHQRQIIAGDYDKDALLKRAQQLISEAEDAVKKYGQGKQIDVQVINNEVVILKNLVKEINEATNPQALTMLEANLAEHEEIIRKWLDDIEPKTTQSPTTKHA
uniref:Histidine-rich glycoprotein-like n=1 Tax=Dermatophagoides pteronyssinus TaxID=6956 RepID=A0A6P6YGW4_DERPT|nr:histidine-rich glycoprotein-like [Dermatophagoides pteronyssinus]